MALRYPGPLGFPNEHRHYIDEGTLARTRSLVPLPTGLAIWSPAPNQLKPAVKAALVGLTVNPASKISGKDWKAKIDSSPYVPDYFKQQIAWKNDTFTTPKRFKFPSNVIKMAWLDDWLSAFVGSDWELSTHRLEVTAEASGRVTEKVVPHLSTGEAIGYKLTNQWNAFADVQLTMGWTFEKAARGIGATLNSGRGVVLVATEIQLTMRDGKREKKETFQVSDDDLVRVWFHEIAVHAGRQTAGLPSAHGDLTVDTNTREIEDMFTNARTVEKVAAAMKAFFPAPKAAPAGKK